MKPISVRFQCFGPYRTEQKIDFKALSDKGIFLISGETGSGKTTILDAICYALYGKSSGGLRGDIEVMRNQSAKENEETFVEYIFESNGQTYKFHRELRYGRTNMNEYDGCEILKDGVFEPIFENPKKTFVNKEAEKIIGLTYEQFCQVVLLPQGKFEQLLVSNSEEKQKILTSLFHAEHWNQIVMQIKDRVDAENKRLDTEQLDIMSKLDVFSCTSLEALQEKIEAHQKALDEKKKSLADLQKAKDAFDKSYEKVIQENEAFKAYHDAISRVQALSAKQDIYREKKQILSLASMANAIKEPYQNYQSAKTAQADAKSAVENAIQKQDSVKARFEQVQAVARQHAKETDAYEGAKQKRTRLLDSQTLYAEIAKQESNLQAAQTNENACRLALENAKQISEQAKKAWNDGKEKNDVAIAQYQSVSKLYQNNIAGILAKDLKENCPCAVCGSLVHPNPALLQEGLCVSQEDVDKANKEIQKTSAALEALKETRTQKEELEKTATEKWQKAKDEFLRQKAAYEVALKQRIEGILTLSALQKELTAVQKNIDIYEKTERDLAPTLQKVSENLAAATQSRKEAEGNFEKASHNLEKSLTIWQTALQEKGFENTEAFKAVLCNNASLLDLQKEISDFEAALASSKKALQEQKEKLSKEEAPDMVKLGEKKEQIEDAFTKMHGEKATLENEIEREVTAHKSLSARWETYLKERVLSDSNVDFLRKLNPSSGMSLQRYVLGVMLTSITVAANQLLKNVHAGKYQLLRSDASAGSSRKAGLELNVLDTSNGEERSVTTLSGGEKFLVSLCLAIGLSTVVQAQSSGTKLEAMFIDEGFGSLDGSSIDDALDVLQSVQKSHSLVGIISHVDKLSETIPTRLDVLKGANGNQIHVVF